MSSDERDPLQTLTDAVERNAGIVLSLPSSGLIQNIKSRFLSQTPEGIWAELDFDMIAPAEDLAESGNPMAVSFRIGRQRVTFAAQVLRVQWEFEFNPQTIVPAVLVAKPVEINVTQRRASYRVVVFENSDLLARFWTIEDHTYLGDRPSYTQEIKARVMDASVGGLGIRIPREIAETRDLIGGQRLRVLLEFQGIELLLDARLRFNPRRDTDKSIAAGVTFKKLDVDVDARQKLDALTHIIGELQLEEVRRNRSTLAS